MDATDGPVGRFVDLGCGSGELTALAVDRLGATDAVGIDSSPAMLDEAAAHAGPGLRFEPGDIAEFGSGRPSDLADGPYAIVLSNAALQWVGDHPTVLARWASTLAPGGQLAVQVPANVDHPAHSLVADVAQEAPFLDAFDGEPPPDPVRGVLAPQAYAELLHDLGFAEQHVRLQVYPHVLGSTADVVQWVRGTTLTRIRKSLPPGSDLYDRFVERYTQRLLATVGDHQPYFYAFKRILLWARR
jgi:trans-aconitate 2-methyltransferase